MQAVFIRVKPVRAVLARVRGVKRVVNVMNGRRTGTRGVSSGRVNPVRRDARVPGFSVSDGVHDAALRQTVVRACRVRS